MSAASQEPTPIDKDIQKQLDSIQDHITRINSDMVAEVNKVQRRFQEQMQPVFDERAEIFKKIPHFWSTTLRNHPSLQDLLADEDTVSAIDHLVDITFIENKEPDAGFTIRFEFTPNEYFDNQFIDKNFKFSQFPEDPEVTGSAISWKAGKNIVEAVKRNNQANHEKKRQMKDKKKDDSDSDDDYDDIMTIFELFNKDEKSAQIPMIIKDEIFPDPLKYYLGTYGDDEDSDDDVEDSSDDDAGHQRKYSQHDKSDSDSDADDDDGEQGNKRKRLNEDEEQGNDEQGNEEDGPDNESSGQDGDGDDSNEEGGGDDE
ncbi:MAG: putative nucleosome assembly protein [Streblomastix strix]|uniref:Putative nucleosome assembly protein n=1 Tax=Streblomastix strix TaxID=222440 RepID=A0A5J4U3K9_9EUKA|nr:MAG: putative nucleosome assembly protein [Streblomastix strix]